MLHRREPVYEDFWSRDKITSAISRDEKIYNLIELGAKQSRLHQNQPELGSITYNAVTVTVIFFSNNFVMTENE